MTTVCGIDGCKEGWVVVSKDLDSGEVSWRQISAFAALVDSTPVPAVIAVDVPIGLTDSGGRDCDLQARSLLGRPRGSSVFPAPNRAALKAANYEEACRARLAAEGKSMSKQSWAIVPKIAEVDECLRSGVLQQGRVREVHPEVCFYYLAGGRPMTHKKKRLAGRNERLELLNPIYPQAEAALSCRKSLCAAADDILDAFAALWTAERLHRGEDITLPDAPPVDSVGLWMEIVV